MSLLVEFFRKANLIVQEFVGVLLCEIDKENRLIRISKFIPVMVENPNATGVVVDDFLKAWKNLEEV